MPLPLVPLLRNKETYPYAATNELLYGLTTGLNCLGYEEIIVGNVTAVPLTTIPVNATFAVIVAEGDVTNTDQTRVVRYREDTVSPTPSTGMPLGDLTIYECGGVDNMANIKFIGIEASKSQKLRVSYYG